MSNQVKNDQNYQKLSKGKYHNKTEKIFCRERFRLKTDQTNDVFQWKPYPKKGIGWHPITTYFHFMKDMKMSYFYKTMKKMESEIKTKFEL